MPLLTVSSIARFKPVSRSEVNLTQARHSHQSRLAALGADTTDSRADPGLEPCSCNGRDAAPKKASHDEERGKKCNLPGSPPSI